MISVIISYYKSSHYREAILKHTLRRIQNQTYSRDKYEIILVKDDWDVNIDLSGIDKTLCLKHTKYFNKSWYYNCAVKETRKDTEWLLFLDADSVFRKDYIYRILELATDKDKVYACLDTFIRQEKDLCEGKDNPSNDEVEHNSRIEQIFEDIYDMRYKERAELTRIFCMNEFSIRDYTQCAICGCVFLITPQKYWDIGGMNENYFGYGSEDGDFRCRIGKDLVYLPFTVVHPYHPGTVPADLQWQYDHNVLTCEKIRSSEKNKDIAIERLKKTNLGDKMNGPATFSVSDLKMEWPEGVKSDYIKELEAKYPDV